MNTKKFDPKDIVSSQLGNMDSAQYTAPQEDTFNDDPFGDLVGGPKGQDKREDSVRPVAKETRRGRPAKQTASAQGAASFIRVSPEVRDRLSLIQMLLRRSGRRETMSSLISILLDGGLKSCLPDVHRALADLERTLGSPRS